MSDLGFFLGNRQVEETEHVVDRARRELAEAVRKQEPQAVYDQEVAHTMSMHVSLVKRGMFRKWMCCLCAF